MTLNLSVFAERLEELIFEKNEKPYLIARELGFANSAFSLYLRGITCPTLSSLIKIADYFSVSCDFLLGIENESYTREFLPATDFKDRFKELLENRGYTKYRFCKETKISESRVYEWLNGKRQPSVENVMKIAEFFALTFDGVLGRTK